MNSEEQNIERKAKEFIKRKKDYLIDKFANKSVYKPVPQPVSLFMAGSPGAGKTEISKSLVQKFKSMPVRIDADEIRKECPGYTGTNAHLFQSASVKGVNILLDYALANNLNFILDGTFAYADPIYNIQRSIDHNRVIEVWFVYQKPELAWEFTKAREVIESRKVSKEKFIEAFINSKNNAIKAKKHFQKSLELNILVKNIDNTDGSFTLNTQTEELDRDAYGAYTKDELIQLLK